MSVLGRELILKHLKKEELIRDVKRSELGVPEIESASCDLRAGVLIWRDPDSDKGKGAVQTRYFNATAPVSERAMVTIHPGQMMFVITFEELIMPLNVCGTVFSRNKLARDGILALNAGHVDPGYEGPIAIRLINLRSVPYVITVGDTIYTVVFQQVSSAEGVVRRRVTKEEMVKKYVESANLALCNALYDLSLTRHFVQKEEFGQCLAAWVRSNIWKLSAYFIAFLSVVGTIIKFVPFIKDMLKLWVN